MSRLTGNEVHDLMEAYNSVYNPTVYLSEEEFYNEVHYWVNVVLDEGYDLSDYTWDDVYAFAEEYYLYEDEYGRGGRAGGQGFGQALRNIGGAAIGGLQQGYRQLTNLGRGAIDVTGAAAQGLIGQQTTSSNPLAQLANTYTRTQTALPRAGVRFTQGAIEGLAGAGGSRPSGSRPGGQAAAGRAGAAAGRAGAGSEAAARDALIAGARSFLPPPGTYSNRPSGGGGGTAARPSGGGAGTAARPSGGGAGTAATVPSRQTGNKEADMATWAKAHPDLATAAAERARIRGTQETDNPLMKDFRSRLPAASSPQSPAVANLGAGNQSLVNNPNAIRPVPTPATRPAVTPAATGVTRGRDFSISGTKSPTARPTPTSAARPTPTPVATPAARPMPTPARRPV